MDQRNSIILWRNAEENSKTFDIIASETFEVLKIFRSYPYIFRPKYVTAKSKNDIREFNWDYEFFYDLLKKGINRNGNTVFEDIGYTLSFFSSINSCDSSYFSLHVGNKDPQFNNTFIVDLPVSYNLYDENNAKLILEIFEKLVVKFSPYWGCVSNKILSQKYRPFFINGLPSTLHWINYFSEEIIKKIGEAKLNAFVNNFETVTNKNGIIMIKKTAIDTNNLDEMNLHSELQRFLFEKYDE